MDRDALLAYLTGWWPELIAEASIDTDIVLDAVESYYTADPTLEETWAQPLADYFVLRRALTAFIVDFDVTTEGDSYRLSQRADRLQKLFEAAYGKVSWLVSEDDADIGAVVTVSEAYTTGPALALDGTVNEWS